MNKERLRFTDEERADPVLEKPIRKVDKAAAKADKAQAKIPKKQVRQKTVDPETGKVTTKLVLEDKKKPPSKLSHALRDTPANAAMGKIHKEIRETEQDNVGVESAHKSEEVAETGARLMREGYRSHKLKPYRKAAQAEQKLEKANVNALYQKSLRENPQLASNPISRWQQKQAIKKEYAAAKRAGQAAGNTASTAKKTGKAAKTVKEKAQQAGAFVMRHKKGFLIAGAIFLLVCMLLNTMSSCSMMAQSIPIPVCLVECLKEAKKKSTSDYVVANGDGNPLSYTQFKRLWQYIVTRTAKPRMAKKLVDGKYVKYMLYPKLGEKARNNGHVVYSLDFDVTPHQLRHTYITNLIHASVDPKTVQYLAGHESSKITMDIYAKVKYNRPDDLVKTMGCAFDLWDAV